MSREYLAEFLLKKMHISASQEEVLNAIPGWEEEVGGIIDDTPSQPDSPGTQQRIFYVSGSSVSDDLEEDLSQKPVEWASPEPTPKAARHNSAIGVESCHEPFDSDRSQSPKKRLSWGFSSPRDRPLIERNHPDADMGDKVTSVVDSEHGVTEALYERENAAAGTSTAAQHSAGDFEDPRREENEKIEPWGQPLNPDAEEQCPSVPSRHSEPTQEGISSKSFNAGTIASDLSARTKPSAKAACNDDGGVCGRASLDNLKANEKTAGCPPQLDSRSALFASSGKDLKADSASSTHSSSDAESEERDNPSMPPKAVQKKLEKIRKLGAEEANLSRKRRKGEHKTFDIPGNVMDVLMQISDSRPAPIFSASDLLNAALRAGITLPPPFSRNYFKNR